ncbi:hypothetical protein BGZ76_009464 [Entomortierella beljakovae]|nr:hypothetical protein BGZ76_009464 [Entomortierella beljakovae]
MVVSLDFAFSWQAFADLLLDGFNKLSVPETDHTTIIYDFLVFHSSTDPLIAAIRFSLGVALFCWFQYMASGINSWIDKLRSITPIIYSVHFVIRDKLYWPEDTVYVYSPRLIISGLLVVSWGVRLTHNFYIKGGYSLDYEDYRWPYLRKKTPGFIWFFFNTIYVCIFQQLLLVALTVPVYTVWRASSIENVPLNWFDAVAIVVGFGALIFEGIVDQQMWNFQQAKKVKIANKETLTGDFKRGYITSGYFKYSRHPHYFAEMTIWWSLYLFTVAAGYPNHVAWFNPSIVGIALFTLIFQGATAVTEKISVSKYPSYKLYQSTTSRIIPFFAGKSLDELERKSQ